MQKARVNFTLVIFLLVLAVAIVGFLINFYGASGMVASSEVLSSQINQMNIQKIVINKNQATSENSRVVEKRKLVLFNKMPPKLKSVDVHDPGITKI